MTTSAAEWKKDKGPQALEVPSGKTCLARRKPLQAFVKAGQVPNSLISIIKQSLKSGSEIKFSDIEWDDVQLVDMVGMMDLIVIECVVEPKVYLEPPGGEERDEEKLYIDEVDEDDKTFIYQWATGMVDDLASFRRESAVDVAATRTSEGVEHQAVEPVGDRG